MAEYYFKTFQDYLKALCIEHVDLLHDDIFNRIFIRMNSEEDVMAIPHNAGTSLVIVERVFGRAIGAVEERKLLQSVRLFFVCHATIGDGSPYAAIEAAQDKAFHLMLDFYSRMVEDMTEDDCGPLRNLEAEQMNFDALDLPILEHHFGWEMTIPFKVNTPAYNAAKWNRP